MLKYIHRLFARVRRLRARPDSIAPRQMRLEPLETRDMLAIGSLDPSFNNDGKATFLFQSAFSADATAVALQSDGKVIVAGQSNSSTNGFGFAVARMNVDGSLDTTFDGDGRTEVGFNLGTTGFKNDYVHDVALQADGKIVVVGYAEKNTNDNDVAITRLNTDGSLDTTFGTNGRKTVDFRGGLDAASSVAIQTDGKIVVGGIARFSQTAYQGFVMRLTTAGALDTTFGGGNDGYQAISFHDDNGLGLDAITDIAIQTNGKIVAVGSSYSASGDYDIGIARLNSNGTSDTTFGDDENLGGINPDGENTLALDFGKKADDQATAVKIAADGKIYVAGYFDVGLFSLTDQDENFLLARFTSTGLLDTSFASGQGHTNTSFDLGTNDEDFIDRANDLIIQPDGKLLLVGEAHGDGSHSRFAVARFNTTGLIDTTFTSDGKITTSFGSGFASGRAAALQSNGTVVIAGTYDSTFALTRVLTATPVVSLSATTTTISEQAGTSTVRATMSTPASETVTVNLSFGGTATNNADYSRSGTVITLPAGQTSGSVTVTAIGDAAIEGTETVTVGISSITNGSENGSQSVTVSIRDVLKPVLSGANDVVALTFTSANAFTLTINGASQAYSISTVSEIVIDGLGGVDTFSSSTPFANDATTLQQDLVQSLSTNYRFSVLNAERVYLYGNSGDTALFQDTAANDLFWALPSYSIMAGPGYNYLNQVIGFGPITATATAGNDLSQLYGDAGVQAYVGLPSGSTMTGNNLSFQTSGFDQNYAYAVGGNDTAVIDGGTGDDTVYGLSAYSVMSGPGVFQYIVGYPNVTVNSGGGAKDIALLYDSPGNDTLTGSPTTAVMVGTGFSNRVNNFDQVHGIANTGVDTATLDGSAGNDVFYGYQSLSQLFATGVYFIQTNIFDLTHVNLSSGGGSDVALLFDGTGNDQLTAAGNQAELLYANGVRNRVNAFDAVYAYSQNGGTNKKTVTNPLAFGLVFNGTWV